MTKTNEQVALDKAHAIMRMWLESDDSIPAAEQRDRLVEDIRDAILWAFGAGRQGRSLGDT